MIIFLWWFGISKNFFFRYLTTLQIEFFLFQNRKQYKLSDFVGKKNPITAEAFRYLIDFDRPNLLLNYESITPSNENIQYHTLLPFHSNGISKNSLNFRELINLNHTSIMHFTSFLDHKDEYENDKSLFLIQRINGHSRKLEEKMKKKFTLIYLITISKPTHQILYQIKVLSHEEVAFIIFFDNKSDRKKFYSILAKEKNNNKFKNVYIIDSPRFSVSWAQITQALTQVVLNLAAIKYFPKSLYISFHSESDYPIVPNNFIVRYLKANYPKNYMITFEDRKKKAYRKETFSIYFNHLASDKILHVMYKLFPKKVIPAAEWRCGWNWFTITLKDSRKMMKKMFERFDIIDTLDYVRYADEILFNTLAAEANISITNQYLRHINWTGCVAHPNVFTEKSYEELVSQKCAFWARKFSLDKSYRLMKMLDKHLKKKYYINMTDFC
ncbi:Xylosyltransferase 2 [Tritrichomonas musculus]|uniref:Xylosyltransferase 2 n=1 Tax=Tritrichomonas musculus TaxID=1915356 RepID=A0ABR2HE15_9EUKA